VRCAWRGSSWLYRIAHSVSCEPQHIIIGRRAGLERRGRWRIRAVLLAVGDAFQCPQAQLLRWGLENRFGWVIRYVRTSGGSGLGHGRKHGKAALLATRDVFEHQDQLFVAHLLEPRKVDVHGTALRREERRRGRRGGGL
jgi:hypothetical protein